MHAARQCRVPAASRRRTRPSRVAGALLRARGTQGTYASLIAASVQNAACGAAKITPITPPLRSRQMLMLLAIAMPLRWLLADLMLFFSMLSITFIALTAAFFIELATPPHLLFADIELPFIFFFFFSI
jgi:hypothetical protein